MENNGMEAPNSDAVTGGLASNGQRTLRRGSVLAAAIVAAVLSLAACGSGTAGSSKAGGSTNSQLLAFAGCMRSHGVPNFPDPDSSGKFTKESLQQLGVSSNSQLQAAQSACDHLLPNGGQPNQAQVVSGMLDFARCMRSHGVPNWPDPTTDSRGLPVFDIPGINPDSPQVSNTADECARLLVQSTTGPTTIELCNGVGEDGECHGYGNPNS